MPKIVKIPKVPNKENKEEYNKYFRDYYKKNKDRILGQRAKKIECKECGETVAYGSQFTHSKTKKHMYLSKLRKISETMKL
jgi:hypothetical protein